MRPVAFLLAAALLLASPAEAQEVPEPGTRVRVTHAEPGLWASRLVGTVVEASGASITLRPDREQREITIPRASVQRLEISRGRRTRVFKGIGYGFLLGAGAGAMVGFGIDVDGNDARPEHVAAAYGALGAVAGALIGGVALHGPADRWREVPAAPASEASVSGEGAPLTLRIPL